MMTPTHHSWESSPPGISFLLLRRSSHQFVLCWPALVSTITLNADPLCTVQCLAEREQGAVAAGVLSWFSQRATLAFNFPETIVFRRPCGDGNNHSHARDARKPIFLSTNVEVRERAFGNGRIAAVFALLIAVNALVFKRPLATGS